MKEYAIKGYLMLKDQEDKGWQPIQEGLGIKLPDNINPYEAISANFKTIASHWIFTTDEITKKEE